MSVLVEYACRACGGRQELWAAQPIPATTPCANCAEPARRRFGAALLTGASGGPRAAEPAPAGHSHAVPGSCVLQPTAARMLEARIKGDRRAVERETGYQEKAIRDGRLDPARPPVLASPAQPPAA